MKAMRSLLIYLALIIVVWVLFGQMQQQKTAMELNYTQFMNLVNTGQVADATIRDQNATGKLKNGQQYHAFIPDDPAIYEKLIEKGVMTTVQPPSQTSAWITLLFTTVPVLLMAGLFFYMLQQSQGSGNRVMQFGRSRAKMVVEDKTRVTFDDLGGVDEVKEEFAEVVDFLKHPKRYLELGARIPKGVLLFGAPGTGKTHLARAVAGEAGVPFFSISGSDFVEMFVGVGAARVRDLFEQAKRNSPCIVFIDEIDAVGRQRGAGYGGGHDEREQTLNQLLVEMDGFGVNEGIIVIAATNRPDVLDPALLRPGRFDRQIVVDRPDIKGRLEILKIHTKNKKMAEDVNLERLAQQTPGFTGADLETLTNEAALLAARRRKKKITMAELEEAIDRVVAGPERKTRVISEKEKRILAYHEAAHALVGKILNSADPVHKVTIIPRGQALGYTLQMPVEDRYLITREDILNRVAMTLAGRVAEEMVFNEISTGAGDDLEKATKWIRKMVTEFGMSEKLGPLTFGNKQEEVFLGRDITRQRDYSEEVAAEIDEEVRRLVGECYTNARRILERHRDKLDAIAAALIEKESLNQDDIDAIVNGPEKGGEAAPTPKSDVVVADRGTEPIGPGHPTNPLNPTDPAEPGKKSQ